VNELIGREFEAWGRQLAPHERVRAFAILPEPLSIATGELTSSLKLRRDRIEERHRELVERLYGSGAGHDGVHLELADPRAR
jgi:long-chain acyl-CoA synthetase